MCLERLCFSSSYPIFYLLLLLFLHFPSRMFTRYKLAPLLKMPKKGLPLRTFLLPCLVVCFRKKHRQSFLRLCRRVSAAPRCHWRSDGRETEAQPTIKKILIRLTNYNDLLPFRFFIYSKSPVDSSSTKGTNTIAGTHIQASLNMTHISTLSRRSFHGLTLPDTVLLPDRRFVKFRPHNAGKGKSFSAEDRWWQ